VTEWGCLQGSGDFVRSEDRACKMRDCIVAVRAWGSQHQQLGRIAVPSRDEVCNHSDEEFIKQ